MTLLQEIQTKCSPELIASRDHGAIAAAVSEGRTRATPTAIGKGTILGVLDLAAGNAFLDVIDTVPDFRHVKDVIKSSNFDVSLQVSQDGIDAMVPAVLTQVEADALKALGKAPNPITEFDVRCALYDPATGDFLG